MKSTFPMSSKHAAQAAAISRRRQGGAVIIVVLSLLTTLLFLAIFFFNWTSNEVASAQNFAESKLGLSVRINPIPIFDQAAEQLIVGTSSDNEFSALWGGMHSILATRIGRIDENLMPTDGNVGTGTGIIMQFKDEGPSGIPDGRPDLEPDGLLVDPDDYQFLYADFNGNSTKLNIQNFIVNYSKLARPTPNTETLGSSGGIPLYRPDAGYTYPDINSLFLAHEETASDPTNAGAGSRHVLIPSFFRPQLFPEHRDAGDFTDLYLNIDHKAKIFRPSREHQYPDSTPRYLTDLATPAMSGDRTRSLSPFPFEKTGTDSELGVFTNPSNPSESYRFLDVDLDKDGVNDAIWIDLDLPMQTLSGDRQYVPLASFKVIDADGLLNLSAHGNLQGQGQLARSQDGGEPLSVSNLGMSRSEINPIWALSGDLSSLTPAETDKALQNVADFLGVPVSSIDPADKLTLANLEWEMMLKGFVPSTGQAITGRYGDRDSITAGSPRAPGYYGTDDNNNSLSGTQPYGQGIYDTANLNGLWVPGFQQPLSPLGLGTQNFLSAGLDSYLLPNGTRNLGRPIADNPSGWPAYFNFQVLSATDYYPDLMMGTPTLSPLQMLIDEEAETVIDPSDSRYGMSDSPFDNSDVAYLHLTNIDQYKAGISSRLSSLAAANFQHASNAEKIRRQFTSESWDRLEFNFAPPTFRTWEWQTSQGNQFPPMFAISGTQVQPFRAELRQLFHTDVNTTSVSLGESRVNARHRLNLNQILSNDQMHGGTLTAFENSNPRYRNLTPHQTQSPAIVHYSTSQ